MDYILPKIFKTRFAQNIILNVSPLIHSRSAGFYVYKGSLKGIVSTESNEPIEINFPEKTFILDEGFKIHPSDDLIKWESILSSSTKEWRYDVILNGWQLIAQEHGTTTICLFHDMEKEDDIINIIHDKTTFSRKVDLTNAVWSYSVKGVKEEDKIQLPEGHFLCLAYGKALINGELKNKKTWIRSTKDQIVNVINQHDDESIFFISKIK